MPKNSIVTPKGESTIAKLRKSLTPDEHREWLRIDEATSRMWRNFWVKVMKARGYSNVAIAAEVGLTESTVRAILKK